MSPDTVPTEYVVDGSEVVTVQQQDAYVSKRGRRVLVAAIVILVLLLLASMFFLYQIANPRGVAQTQQVEGVTWIRSIYGWGSQASELVSPATVAVDPSGNGEMWIADQANFRIAKFDANGNYADLIIGSKDGSKTFDYPSSFAVAPDGWMYVAQSSYNNILVFDASGNLTNTIPFPNPSSIDVNDEMLVVGAPEGFVAFGRDGTPIGQIGGQRGPGEDQFDMVNGLVLDSDNNVYVTDTFNNRISKYDEAGDRIWMIKTGPAANEGQDSRGRVGEELSAEFPAMLQAPMGATLDGAGRLIVIDLLDFSIAAFDTETGEFIDKWGEFGPEDGMFAYPADIDYDPAFDWFVVADSGNQRAQVIRLPDSGGDALVEVRRFLSGPIRACCLPLILLVIALVVWVVARRRRRSSEVVPVIEPAEFHQRASE